MQMYDLNENEINIISSQNGQSITAFAIASFLLSQVVTIGFDWLDKGWMEIGEAKKILLPIFAIVCAAYFIRGFWLLKNRTSIIEVVKNETKNPTKKQK